MLKLIIINRNLLNMVFYYKSGIKMHKQFFSLHRIFNKMFRHFKFDSQIPEMLDRKWKEKSLYVRIKVFRTSNSIFNNRKCKWTKQEINGILLPKLFWTTVIKFLAFSLEFQKFFSITRKIYSNSEKSIPGNRMFFNLFLEVSQI